MQLTKKEDILKQEYIFIGIAVVIGLSAILISYSMFMPLFRELRFMSSKIKKGQIIMPDRAGYKEEYQRLEKQIDSFKQEITQSKNKLFWKKDITVFLEELKNIAEDLAVDFYSIRPSLTLEPIRSEDNPEIILMYRNPINISIKTGHNELIYFLQRIENSPKFLRLDEINIEPDGRDIYKRNVNMVFSIFSAD